MAISKRLMLLGIMVSVTLALVTSTGASEQPPAPKKSIFSTLKIGQAVTLKEKGLLWEIHTMDNENVLTHKVIEIGDDYIVLLDDPGSVETRIPIYAVRALVHVRLKVK